MFTNYVVIIRSNGIEDSYWHYKDNAEYRAKELRDKGIDCDVYLKVIE
jgi:hypothetical protein